MLVQASVDALSLLGACMLAYVHVYSKYVCMYSTCEHTYVRICIRNVSPPSFPQCLHDAPAVREAAAEALGTALKVVGERGMAAYLDGLESLKMTKVGLCDCHAAIMQCVCEYQVVHVCMYVCPPPS